MKKIAILVALALMPFLVTAQQGNQPNRSNLLEKKLHFFRNQLLLNDKEFKAFRKEFRTYENRRRELFRKKRQIIKSLKAEKIQGLKDEEILKMLKDIKNLERQMFDLKQNYYDRLLQILPPKKVLKYRQAEQRFNKMLLKKRKEKRRSVQPAHSPKRH